ncbi:MAG: antitoxin [Desulfobacteraceae bacterium]|nr:antitoxin [Desulfobacteraceae bacterium]
MKNITVSDTLELSIAERILLVEEIWDSIVAEADAVELTEAEKKLIDERLEEHRRNPEAGSSWEDVYKRITENHEI